MTPANSDMIKKLMWSAIWLVGLIVIGWPVSIFLGLIYVFLLPMSVCIPPLYEITFLLRKGIDIPRFFANGMMRGKPYR